jgi:glycerophosphoryl diester phosphodiesterase
MTGYQILPGQPNEASLVWATDPGHAGVLPWEGDLGVDPLPILSLAQAYGQLIGCYVVNDPERMQHLAALGLWGFVTDAPAVAREALPR